MGLAGARVGAALRDAPPNDCRRHGRCRERSCAPGRQSVSLFRRGWGSGPRPVHAARPTARPAPAPSACPSAPQHLSAPGRAPGGGTSAPTPPAPAHPLVARGPCGPSAAVPCGRCGRRPRGRERIVVTSLVPCGEEGPDRLAVGGPRLARRPHQRCPRCLATLRSGPQRRLWHGGAPDERRRPGRWPCSSALAGRLGRTRACHPWTPLAPGGLTSPWPPGGARGLARRAGCLWAPRPGCAGCGTPRDRSPGAGAPRGEAGRRGQRSGP
jgi:hypothetical protein